MLTHYVGSWCRATAVLLVSGLVVSPAKAQGAPELEGWTHLTSSTRYAFYGRDMRLLDERLTLWVKSVPLQEPEDCKRYPVFSESADRCWNHRKVGVHTSIERWEVDCRAKRYRVLGAASYNMAGETVDTSDEPEAWALLIPDSVAEGIADPLCAAKPLPEEVD